MDRNDLSDVCVYFHSHHWKAVLLGQAVCEDREEWSVQTAKTLCQRLLQDTHTALDKVCVRARTLHQNNFLVMHHLTCFLIFFFFMCCVCLDLRPPPAVWAVSQGAARCGEVTATGGEVHPGKLPWGAGRLAETIRRTVVMPTWCWHRELTSDWCSGLPVATRNKAIGWTGDDGQSSCSCPACQPVWLTRTAWSPVTTGPQVWVQGCWKSVCPVIMALISSSPSTEPRKGQRYSSL